MQFQSEKCLYKEYRLCIEEFANNKNCGPLYSVIRNNIQITKWLIYIHGLLSVLFEVGLPARINFTMQRPPYNNNNNNRSKNAFFAYGKFLWNTFLYYLRMDSFLNSWHALQFCKLYVVILLVSEQWHFNPEASTITENGTRDKAVLGNVFKKKQFILSGLIFQFDPIDLSLQ